MTDAAVVCNRNGKGLRDMVVGAEVEIDPAAPDVALSLIARHIRSRLGTHDHVQIMFDGRRTTSGVTAALGSSCISRTDLRMVVFPP